MTARFLFLLCICFHISNGSSNRKSLKIAAFNIQIFGKAKASKNDVMDDLGKIIKEFDITFIQEIRDIKGKAIVALVELLNRKYGNVWAFKESPRLGRTRSKEQFAFIYNTSSVQIETTYLYDDKKDYFERPPFGVKISFYGKPVVLLGVHIDPDTAEEELGRMVDVYSDASARLDTQDMLIIGDMNAGCGYLSKRALDQLPLWTDPRFTWLLSEDTTIAASSCPYDRIIMVGDGMRRYVGSQHGQVYRFDETLGLTMDEAKQRSDHYPVYISITDDGSTPYINNGKTIDTQEIFIGILAVTLLVLFNGANIQRFHVVV